MYLRANGIDDETVAGICEKLARNTTLKCLDLSMNQLKSPGIKLLAAAIHSNFTLELLGLGSMGLTIEDLAPLFKEFGKIKLNEEEAKLLKEKMKERDMIVEKNKKSRGKKEEPVPKVNRMECNEKGECYEIRKEKFRHLNIMLNKLEDSAVEKIDELLARTGEQFVVTIASKFISKEGYKTLTTKYGSRVIY